MHIEISPVVDTDLITLIHIQYHAYAAGSPISSVLNPKGLTPITVEASRTFMKGELDNNPSTYIMKATNTENGEILGWALWNRLMTKEEMTKETPIPVSPDNNKEAMIAMFTACGKKKDEIMGHEPHHVLWNLTIDPKSQGKGAGKALLAWGLQEADKAQLPVYLEASHAGEPLYKQFGFEEKGQNHIDLRPYGDNDYQTTHACMVKQPKK
ncbi:MAG: hypothetical protein M1827_006397 [Pycnora praestabilis]|nr:MAG: hypothetical protein M1827_006397 [Pycnora praestabilis]